MRTIAVVYWSGTGNTKEMADTVAAGAAAPEVQVTVLPVDQASAETICQYDGIALGCPAMGAEVLEETEMEPFVSAIENKVAGKPMVLFGSYGWGDGQWMSDWADRMQANGADIISEGVIQQGALDETGAAACKRLGAELASAILSR